MDSYFFKQKPLLFINQERKSNQRKSLFSLKVLLGNNFHQFDESPGKYYGETRQTETKLINK